MRRRWRAQRKSARLLVTIASLFAVACRTSTIASVATPISEAAAVCYRHYCASALPEAMV